MEYKYSEEHKQTVIAFLREYIDLCRRHSMMAAGIIGAQTAIIGQGIDEGDIDGRIGEMIWNEYDDSGNRPISEDDARYIYDRVKEVK